MASFPTVQLRANRISEGKERATISGTTTRSAHPKGEDPVPGNQRFQDLLVAGWIRTLLSSTWESSVKPILTAIASRDLSTQHPSSLQHGSRELNNRMI